MRSAADTTGCGDVVGEWRDAGARGSCTPSGVWLATTLLAGLGGTPEFEVPAECGTVVDYRAMLDALGGPGADAPPGGVTIDGPRDDGRYWLRLELPSETRTLSDPDCEALLRSAAVIVTIAAYGNVPAQGGNGDASGDGGLEPQAATEGIEDTTPATSTEDAEVDVTPEPPPASDPDPRPDFGPADEVSPKGSDERRPTRGSWYGGLGAGVGIAYGITPVVGALVEAVGGFGRGPWSGVVALHYVPTTRAREQGRVAAVMAFGGGAVGRRRLGKWVALGLGVDVDWLWGRGEGVGESLSEGAWMVSPRLDVAVVPLQRRRVQLEIVAAARVAALAPRFEVLGFGTVYETPRFGVLAAVRCGWVRR